MSEKADKFLKEWKEKLAKKGLWPPKPQKPLEKPVKKKQSDEELSHQYVQQIFALGRKTCPFIAKVIQRSTQCHITFPANDDTCFEISRYIPCSPQGQ